MTTTQSSLLNDATRLPEAKTGLDIKKSISDLTVAVTRCSNDLKFCSAIEVHRKSRDCWLTLLGQAVYDPNRTPSSTYLNTLNQLVRGAKVVSAIKLSQTEVARRRTKEQYIATIREYQILVTLLRDRGVKAVNLYLEKRK